MLFGLTDGHNILHGSGTKERIFDLACGSLGRHKIPNYGWYSSELLIASFKWPLTKEKLVFKRWYWLSWLFCQVNFLKATTELDLIAFLKEYVKYCMNSGSINSFIHFFETVKQ